MDKTQETLTKKKRQFFITTAIVTLLVIVIAVFAVKIAYKSTWSYDMTEQRLFTLSQQSQQVLEGLGDEVQIAAVYSKGREEMMVQSLLNEYEKSSDKITVEYIDAEREPTKLSKYNLDLPSIPNGTLIVKSGSHSKLIYNEILFESTVEGNAFNGEREITGAIRYVTASDMPVVYMLQGHEEASPTKEMTQAVSALQLDAYEVKTLNLLNQSTVPEDADIIIIPSPKKDITEKELTLLSDYMKQGGNLFLLVDAVMNSNSIQLPNFNKLCNSFGVDITNNYVVEENPSNYMSVSKMYLIPGLAPHAITQSIGAERKMIILPVVRGLGSVDYDETAVDRNPLLMSSDKSWVRSDMTIQDTQKTANDMEGPMPLAYTAVVSNIKWGNDASRVVVIGNTSFAYDGNIEAQANRDLWINCVNWLQGGKSSDIIASKIINANRMIIRGNDFFKLSIICLGVLPLIAFACALLVWAFRRNQ